MLARFVVKNLLSFREQTEFNLFPGKGSRLKHHRYDCGGTDVLKLTALYGANGSGKSNLIKAIALLKDMIATGRIPTAFNNQKFKLDEKCKTEPVELGIEFFCGTVFYYYSISILNNTIVEEYFAQSAVGKGEDTLIFHRKLTGSVDSVEFFKQFTDDPQNKVLAKVITDDLLKAEQPLLFLLKGVRNVAFSDSRNAYDWFNESLTIIFPQTEAYYLVHELDTNPK